MIQWFFPSPSLLTENFKIKFQISVQFLWSLASLWKTQIPLTCFVKEETFTFHCRFLVPGNTQKILTEIWQHFWLKMMVKSGLEKLILKFNGGLQRHLLTCKANSAFLGRFFCTGQNIFSRPLFTIIFKPK